MRNTLTRSTNTLVYVQQWLSCGDGMVKSNFNIKLNGRYLAFIFISLFLLPATQLTILELLQRV